jgi:hypothetical protein
LGTNVLAYFPLNAQCRNWIQLFRLTLMLHLNLIFWTKYYLTQHQTLYNFGILIESVYHPNIFQASLLFEAKPRAYNEGGKIHTKILNKPERNLLGTNVLAYLPLNAESRNWIQSARLTSTLHLNLIFCTKYCLKQCQTL